MKSESLRSSRVVLLVAAVLALLIAYMGPGTVQPAFATGHSSVSKQTAAAKASPAAETSTDAEPETVTADALPTWQINGVVWSQVTVGNTVYATGSFTTARPPGVPVGGAGQIDVGNLIAYDITTGKPIADFSHTLNAQGLSITASPDGSEIYVGGDFTTVDGFAHPHIAAFDTATGALRTSFQASIDGQVDALAATNNTVYAAGSFQSAAGKARQRFAAFDSGSGSLLSWAPRADRIVNALVVSPDKSSVIAGGQFTTLSGVPASGMGSLDAITGAVEPWAANQTIRNGGSASAINSLSTDGSQVYGSGYAFGTGNFEGTFAADPGTGEINWVNDCQGDTYSTLPVGQVLYTTSHVHNCEMIGAFPQTSDVKINERHAMAFTTYATGVNDGPDEYGWNYKGMPDSSILTWFPDFTNGQYTGSRQAGWSVTGNDNYIAIGGEFPTVNGEAQQGLTRFAIKDKAPNKRRPAACYGSSSPAATALAGGLARISWQAATDQDDRVLTYRVYRSGTSAPIYTTSESSQYWDCPQMSYIDSGLSSGNSYTYRVTATDPSGNTYTMPTTGSVTPTGGALSSYDKAVLTDGASSFWTLGESSGSAVYDLTGSNDATAGLLVSRGATGPVSGDPTTASTFSGSSLSYASTNSTVPTTPSFSIEAWVKTTSHSGGKIVGYGSSRSGSSSSYDRQVYMDNSGHLLFGVYPGTAEVVTSPGTYNDGSWHHVVATLDDSAGMKLYVDGEEVDADSSVTTAQAYSGYWRIGGDNLNGWPSQPSSNYFTGTIGDVAIYPSALSTSQIQSHYTGAGGALPNQAPSAAFSSSVQDLKASFDGSGSSDSDGSVASYSWDFGDSSAAGSGVSPDHTYADAGTYTVTLTVTDDDGATDSVSHDVTVTAPPVNQAPSAAFTSSVQDLKASFDGSGSSDSDGSVASYSWDFGDSSAAGSGVSPDHTYADAGTYTVTLTVTDDDGATDSVSHDVTVTAPPVNQAPSAAFSSSVQDLTASFTNSSSDPDGDTLSYAWDFGDGATSTDKSPAAHTYSTGGTYTVKLTVTDPGGLSDSVSHDVTVNAPAATLVASDDFGRNISNGWGTADVGGSWLATGTKSAYSTDGDHGVFTFSKAGTGPSAQLNGVSVQNTDIDVSFSLTPEQTGGGMYIYVVGRRVADVGDYRAKVQVRADNSVWVGISKFDGGTEVATLPMVRVSGLTYTPGSYLNVRFEAMGTNPTTLGAKVWQDGTTEPVSWQITGTDTTPGLQRAGAVSIGTYLSGSATDLPVLALFKDLRVYDASNELAQAKTAAPTMRSRQISSVRPLEPVTRSNAKALHAQSRWWKP